MKIVPFRITLFFLSALTAFLFARPLFLGAQDFSGGNGDNGASAFDEAGFGFGGAVGGPSASPGLSVNISGEVTTEITAFYDDFSSARKAGDSRLGDIFRGILSFKASGSAAEAVITAKLNPAFDGSFAMALDEAYLRAFFGPLAVTGGLLKLSWGKADSFGPLDVINPLDYTDLSKITDPESIKIARPMIHAALPLGDFSKFEAVFVPWFEGDKFAMEGRWMPGQIKDLRATAKKDLDKYFPETGRLEYAQAGARFTATIGSSDFGFQYYFGRLPRPAPVFGFTPLPVLEKIDYNSVHRIGADFARVIAGFNVRAEAGANISGDSDGSDAAVYNPALVWSLGFDRNLFLGINLNLQANGGIRLFHDKTGVNPLDCENGTDMTSTRITGIFSRKFFGDEFEIKTTALWGIEDRDFLVIPALAWSRNGLAAELAAGFFGGEREGELGQYSGSGFARISLTYIF